MISSGWPAPAKLNLFLHIIGKRSDGFHLLQTVFQFIELAVNIDFTITESGLIQRNKFSSVLDENEDRAKCETPVF